MTKHRSQIEIKALDTHLIYGVEKGWKNSAIAHEAGVSDSYCTVRLKALGYQSMLLSPLESELIREARRQKAIAA